MGAPSTTKTNPLSYIFDPIGNILDLAFNWYAVGEQKKENRRAAEREDRYFAESMGWDKEKFAAEMGLAKEQLGLSKRQMASAERIGTRQLRETRRQARAGEKLAGEKLGLEKTGQEADIELARAAEARAGKGQEAQIALGERGMAIEENRAKLDEKTVKFNQVTEMMDRMTRFVNSPAARAQFISPWSNLARGAA